MWLYYELTIDFNVKNYWRWPNGVIHSHWVTSSVETSQCCEDDHGWASSLIEGSVGSHCILAWGCNGNRIREWIRINFNRKCGRIWFNNWSGKWYNHDLWCICSEIGGASFCVYAILVLAPMPSNVYWINTTGGICHRAIIPACLVLEQ